MHTDSTSGSSALAERQPDAGPGRRAKEGWWLPISEVAVCTGLYMIAASEIAERWTGTSIDTLVVCFVFPVCWTALVMRRAKSRGVVLDSHTARGRYVVEGVAWRTLVPAAALSTVLLMPFWLLQAAFAHLGWPRVVAYLAVGLLTGLLGGLWRARRSRPSSSLEGDRQVLAQLRKAGADLSKPTEVNYYLYFQERRAAESAASEVGSGPLAATVRRAGDDSAWLCLVSGTMVPSESAIRAYSTRLVEVARRHGGEYDGWEAAIAK